MIEGTVFNIIGFICLVVVFVTFEPLNKLRREFEDEIEDDVFFYFCYKLLTCAKCAGLWFGLFFFWNIYIAAIISISSELIYRRIINFNN